MNHFLFTFACVACVACVACSGSVETSPDAVPTSTPPELGPPAVPTAPAVATSVSVDIDGQPHAYSQLQVDGMRTGAVATPASTAGFLISTTSTTSSRYRVELLVEDASVGTHPCGDYGLRVLLVPNDSPRGTPFSFWSDRSTPDACMVTIERTGTKEGDRLQGTFSGNVGLHGLRPGPSHVLTNGRFDVVLGSDVP